MFTQEEFESAYEIVSGFNNIRKQITGDPKLLTELYKLYKNRGNDIKDYSEVDDYITGDVRYSVLDCYFFLGYPHEYDRNIFEFFDLLSQVFLDTENELDYSEYEKIWTSPSFVQRRDYYKKVYSICYEYALKYTTFARLYSFLLKTDIYIAEKFLILIKKTTMRLSKNSQYVSSEGDIWYTRLLFDDLGLKEDDKPEYKIKREEKIKISIDSDFFDLIDKITTEFDSFVKNELLNSTAISRYFSTHEPFCSIIEKRNIEIFV